MKDGLRQQPSSSAIAEVEQGDRRDPITVVIAGPPVAKARPFAPIVWVRARHESSGGGVSPAVFAVLKMIEVELSWLQHRSGGAS
jgi:hypothetical protein